jgi:hypothetical protein
MTDWSEREEATLIALAETFVGGDAERRGRLAGEALLQTADPAQLAQLRFVLRAIMAMARRVSRVILAER